jgi:hypothetical protein
MTKRTALDIADGRIAPDELPERLAREAADCRRSAEAAEGLASFFEKRKPRWYPDQS